MSNDFLRDSCSIKNTSVINDLLWGSCCRRYLAALRRIISATNVSCYIWSLRRGVYLHVNTRAGDEMLPLNLRVYLEPWALLQDHLLFTRTSFMARTICHSPPFSECSLWSPSTIQAVNVHPTVRWPMCKMDEEDHPSSTQKGCSLHLPPQK